MADRPSKARTIAPAAVDARPAAPDASWADHESALHDRLGLALAALPEDERTAVVAAYGFAGGPVGAAMELDLDVADADAVTRSALQLLRAALSDVDAHGTPLA